MGALDNTLASEIMSATLPCGTSGAPSASFWTGGGLASGGMKIRLTTSLSTAAAAGTTLSGTGSGDYTITTSSDAPSLVDSIETVTLPAVSGGTGGSTYWTNGSGDTWDLYSVEVQDNSNDRAWWGPITDEPVAVGNGNSFAFAQNSITATLD